MPETIDIDLKLSDIGMNGSSNEHDIFPGRVGVTFSIDLIVDPRRSSGEIRVSEGNDFLSVTPP